MQRWQWGNKDKNPVYNVEASKQQELVAHQVCLELGGRVKGKKGEDRYWEGEIEREEEIERGTDRDWESTHNQTSRITLDFPTETLEASRKCSNAFKTLPTPQKSLPTYNSLPRQTVKSGMKEDMLRLKRFPSFEHFFKKLLEDRMILVLSFKCLLNLQRESQQTQLPF